jgi:hypothetical protein
VLLDPAAHLEMLPSHWPLGVIPATAVYINFQSDLVSNSSGYMAKNFYHPSNDFWGI